eukprot:TRINITY_DN2136_c0_g1_i1.p1 TRINITY_DN2136_c0_g1~~TRINITY_DN2136_c0_g1_i1.p1  ORF type:complete len:377 (-),score=108.78 TRINITY_DN2136_c0_g1_i1:145-1275(-)
MLDVYHQNLSSTRLICIMRQNIFQKHGITISDLSIDVPKMIKAKNKSVRQLTNGIGGLFKKNKVNYSQGWGKITGPNQVTVSLNGGGEEVIETDNIVIATGSTHTPLNGVDVDEKDIVSSTGALDFSEVPKSMVVIGAGVIGLEMGSVWSRLGAEVTVVEFLDRICPGIDAQIAKDFQKLLKKQGIKFKLSTKVMSAETGANGVTLSLDAASGGSPETVEAEKVLLAIGRIPYTENLGVQDLGLSMEGLKVNVNEKWQTNIPSIYAIGDVITGPMLAHKAEEEGIAVMEQLAGKGGHVNYNAIPSVIYTYPEVAFVGKTEEDLNAEGIEYNKGVFPFMANSRAKTNDDFDGMVKFLSDKKTDRVLGIHIIGSDAGE